MNYKFKFSILFLFVFILGACAKEQLPPPNIVWLTTEDNSVHYLKLYDEHGIEMPNIESLTTSGLVFENCFSNAAVCSAARSTIISSCYGPRVAAHYHRKEQLVPMPEGISMYPTYLQKAGYYVTNNNKEDYNIVKDKGVWHESNRKATWRNRAEGQPFFHVHNFNTTHESRLHFSQADFEEGKTQCDKASQFIFPNHPNTELFKYTNARYRDKHTQIDNEMGVILDQLKEDGLMENTFIFFYGDHGGVLPGSKGYLYESGLHVPLVVYVPEMYRDLVDFELGTRVDGFVEFVDLPATVLNLAGVELPEGIDGEAFLGKGVSAADVNARDEAYGYADRFDEKYDMVRTMRKGKLKYMRSYQPFNFDGLYNEYRYKQLGYQEWKKLYVEGKLNDVQSAFFKARPAEMLFDLEADPYETKDLSQDPAYAEQLAAMRTLLQKQEMSMPDLSFYPEYYLINNAFDNPIAFGKEHKSDIARYMAIADLQLLPFAKAKAKIKKALTSDDQFDRYWGLCVASAFGEEATCLSKLIKAIEKDDAALVNKVRAAEFFAIAKGKSPVASMTASLYASKDPVEALLILNSMALMADVNYNYKFNIDNSKLDPKMLDEKSQTMRRLIFLAQ